MHEQANTNTVDARDRHGRTPQSHASTLTHQNTTPVRLLLDAGAGAHILGDRGRSTLHYATLRKNTDVISLLTDRGLTVEIRDENLQTPLHYARGNPVALLLDG